jgi:hypothetical protein
VWKKLDKRTYDAPDREDGQPAQQSVMASGGITDSVINTNNSRNCGNGDFTDVTVL